jgi:hypothetical protein
LKIDHAQKLKIKKIETETETEILKIKRTNIYFFRGWENKKKKTTSNKPHQSSPKIYEHLPWTWTSACKACNIILNLKINYSI